jgi:hypothetical protein
MNRIKSYSDFFDYLINPNDLCFLNNHIDMNEEKNWTECIEIIENNERIFNYDTYFIAMWSKKFYLEIMIEFDPMEALLLINNPDFINDFTFEENLNSIINGIVRKFSYQKHTWSNNELTFNDKDFICLIMTMLEEANSFKLVRKFLSSNIDIKLQHKYSQDKLISLIVHYGWDLIKKDILKLLKNTKDEFKVNYNTNYKIQFYFVNVSI